MAAIDDLKFTNAERIVTKFKDYVISQSRANLTRQKKNVTKNLYDRISGEVVNDGGFFIAAFNLGKYGSFQDQGVQGAVKGSNNNAPNSPFSFKTKRPPIGPIKKWVKARGFLFRDRETGRMMSAETTAYLVRNAIFKNGIKPSLFFTKPFEAGYKKYIDVSLVLAFGDDLETIIDYELNEIPNEIKK